MNIIYKSSKSSPKNTINKTGNTAEHEKDYLEEAGPAARADARRNQAAALPLPKPTIEQQLMSESTESQDGGPHESQSFECTRGWQPQPGHANAALRSARLPESAQAALRER